MAERVTVLGLDAVKLVRYLRKLERDHFHGVLEFKIYDGEIKQVKSTKSLDLRGLWPDLGDDSE